MYETHRITSFFANGRHEIDKAIYVATEFPMFVVINNEPFSTSSPFAMNFEKWSATVSGQSTGQKEWSWKDQNYTSYKK